MHGGWSDETTLRTCHPHFTEGLGVATSGKRGVSPSQRPRGTGYIESIRRVL